MGQIPYKKTGLYDHLLQCLAQAIRQEHPFDANETHPKKREVELQGLSFAEWALIKAYLRQDSRWLAGWQAAAHQYAQEPLRSFETRHILLSCAQCHAEFMWPDAVNKPVTCPVCGADTVRIHCQHRLN